MKGAVIFLASGADVILEDEFEAILGIASIKAVADEPTDDYIFWMV